MIAINGTYFYEIGIESIQRGERRDYKYNLITENGRRRSELRARYRTYNVTLGGVNQEEYDRLRAALATNDTSVEITLPDGQEDVTLEATVQLGDDILFLVEVDGEKRWDGLSLSVEGVSPLEDGR